MSTGTTGAFRPPDRCRDALFRRGVASSSEVSGGLLIPTGLGLADLGGIAAGRGRVAS